MALTPQQREYAFKQGLQALVASQKGDPNNIQKHTWLGYGKEKKVGKGSSHRTFRATKRQYDQDFVNVFVNKEVASGVHGDNVSQAILEGERNAAIGLLELYNRLADFSLPHDVREGGTGHVDWYTKSTGETLALDFSAFGDENELARRKLAAKDALRRASEIIDKRGNSFKDDAIISDLLSKAEELRKTPLMKDMPEAQKYKMEYDPNGKLIVQPKDKDVKSWRQSFEDFKDRLVNKVGLGGDAPSRLGAWGGHGLRTLLDWAFGKRVKRELKEDENEQWSAMNAWHGVASAITFTDSSGIPKNISAESAQISIVDDLVRYGSPEQRQAEEQQAEQARQQAEQQAAQARQQAEQDQRQQRADARKEFEETLSKDELAKLRQERRELSRNKLRDVFIAAQKERAGQGKLAQQLAEREALKDFSAFEAHLKKRDAEVAFRKAYNESVPDDQKMESSKLGNAKFPKYVKNYIQQQKAQQNQHRAA